jgi:hypothetical protein
MVSKRFSSGFANSIPIRGTFFPQPYFAVKAMRGKDAAGEGNERSPQSRRP